MSWTRADADAGDAAIVARATPLARRVGAVLYRSHAPYVESVNGAAWQVIDAEAVIAAGPNRDAIVEALRDTGLLWAGEQPSPSLIAELIGLLEYRREEGT